MATNHSRQQWHETEIGFDRDGKIVALVDRFLTDMGAYIRTHGVLVPELTAALLPGPYRVPNYTSDVRCVLTNKTPTGTYRGPGRFESTFVRERLMDSKRPGPRYVPVRPRAADGPRRPAPRPRSARAAAAQLHHARRDAVRRRRRLAEPAHGLRLRRLRVRARPRA